MAWLRILLGETPIYSYANDVANRPLDVRSINPCCNKYGSITSSNVSDSSDMLAAKVSTPTGPPENLLTSASK